MLRIFTRKAAENDPFCGVGLGARVKDTLTGFHGIVISRVEYLTGCNQVFILPESEKPNELKDGHWFDIERVQLIHEKAVDIVPRPGDADIPAPRVDGRRL